MKQVSHADFSGGPNHCAVSLEKVNCFGMSRLLSHLAIFTRLDAGCRIAVPTFGGAAPHDMMGVFTMRYGDMLAFDMVLTRMVFDVHARGGAKKRSMTLLTWKVMSESSDSLMVFAWPLELASPIRMTS